MIATAIDNFFEDFNDIYDERHKYSIEWAFKDAQGKLDGFKKDVIETKLKNKCTFCKSKDKVTKDFMELQKSSKKILKKQKLFSRIFSNMYSLITIFEFMVSIALVLVISELSHSGEVAVESKLFSFWVVMTFAFLKVFIERYIVKPRIEDLGWKLYKKSAKALKELTYEFNKQTNMDLVDLDGTELLEIA